MQTQIIKQAVGIDVSKDSVTVRYGSMDKEQNQLITNSVTFDNAPNGHEKLFIWAQKQKLSDDVPLWFLMEATGVYYENLAYFLSEKADQKVVVILPNKAKSFSKTLEQKSKTDDIDSKNLTILALGKPLTAWNITPELMRQLKALTREHLTLKEMATQVKNQMHAKKNSYKPLKQTIRRLQQQLNLYYKQLKDIEKQIHELVDSDKDLKDRIDKIDKIEGLGLMTIVTIIAETNGFALIENQRQLTSYSGLDVVHNSSGLKKGKTSISKKGNKFIRRALFMPALVAIRYNQKLKELFIRLVAKKNVKKVALIAVARKLLVLIYTIWKNNTDYIPNYTPANAGKNIR